MINVSNHASHMQKASNGFPLHIGPEDGGKQQAISLTGRDRSPSITETPELEQEKPMWLSLTSCGLMASPRCSLFLHPPADHLPQITLWADAWGPLWMPLQGPPLPGHSLSSVSDSQKIVQSAALGSRKCSSCSQLWGQEKC